MLLVLDAASLLELPLLVDDLSDALDVLTDLVNGGQLTYCDEVLAELKRRASGEQVYTWAKAVGEARCHFGADWVRKRVVPEQLPALVDPDDTLDSAPWVVAQALMLAEDRDDVVVLTEEWDDKFTRCGVRAACEFFDVEVERFADRLELLLLLG